MYVFYVTAAVDAVYSIRAFDCLTNFVIKFFDARTNMFYTKVHIVWYIKCINGGKIKG